MTARGNYGVIQKYGQYKLKEPKNMVHISEAIITEDDCTPKINILFPTVKDKIQIQNKANVKPMIPAINETVQLDKQCNEISTKDNKTKLNDLSQEQNFNTNANVSKTKMFIDKKKKERAQQVKLDLLKKKNMEEDRKKKLEQLHLKSKKIIIASGRPKTLPKPVYVHEECTIDKSLPNKTHGIEIDQTWSPPPPPTKFQYDQKRRKIQTNLVKNTTFKTEKTSHVKNPQILLVDTDFTRTVAKPEAIYSKLKLHNDYELVDNSTYNLLTPKIDDVDICLVPKDHSTKLENIGSKIIEEKNCNFSNRKAVKINLSAEFANNTKVDSETQTDLQFQNNLTYNKEMLNCIETIKESLFNVLVSNKMCSESTQTDNQTNPLPSWVSSKESSSQQNSVLNCKNSSVQTEKTNLELCEATNLNLNGFLNTFHVDKIDNVNNVKSTMPNVLNVEDSNKIMFVPCLNYNVMENYLNTYKSSLINETDSLLLEKENKICKEKIHLVNNDELFPKLNEVTNEDITQFMKKLNCDLDFLTKNNCITNDLDVTCKHLELNKNNVINGPSSCFSEFHDEFQAELDILGQLNNSLCDIEKMDSDATTKINKRSINVLHNDCCNLNNMKTTLNFSYSNDVPISCSKLNRLSSNMMSVDKTIIDFSIQMFEQLIKDEELRVKQHLTMNHLREKSLINRLKWEVAMCDLQMTNFKNRPGHEKEFQLFKQQHRGRIKKLENSLSQVKRLGRVIDSVYKQRIVMLEEHLLYLKMQSSSKKVIRKLKNLDKIPKIEECANQSLNSHCFDQCNKTDTIDIKESEHMKTNSSELKASLQNNIPPIISSIDKSKITLRNQATSPIDIETKNIELVEHVKVQTDVEHFAINKSIQTSENFFNCSNNDNENTKLSDAIITNKRSMSPILSTSPVKILRRPSDSSISTNSEQGDMDIQIKNLHERLEAQKLESSKLKKKQKKLKLENLKIKEQELLKQIEYYDKQIEELKRSLLIEIERKSIQVMKNYSIKHNSSKNSTTSDIQNIICYENNYNESEQNSQKSHVSNNKIIHNKNKKKYVCPVTTNHSINFNVPQDELICELQQNVIVQLKENFKNYININSEEIDICKLANESFQSSETNQVCEILLLHQEPTVIKCDTLKHFNNNQTEINIVSLNVQPADILTHASSNNENRSVSNLETNKVVILNLKHLQDKPNTDYDNQEKNSIIKSLITCKNINYNNSNSNFSINSHLQKIPVIDSTKNINDICVKKDNNTIQCEISNNETKIESMDDYSPDFTSDENSSEFQENTNSVINIHDNDKNSESSYEEDRSEEEIMFENKTCIKSYLNNNNTIQDEEKPVSDKIDFITNKIFNHLIKDTKQIIKTNSIKPLPLIKSNELNNLTEETPLLLILKREEEHRKMILLAEQASTISNVLFKRHLQPLLFESFQLYLPKLNEIEVKKLKLYLNWSSNRKKLKLSEYLKCQYKNSNADNDESFEMFYQNYQEQKKSLMFQDDSSTTVLTQTQQEAEKLKAEQMRIEEEIERLCKSDESQFFLREIPNKPPPPYKSPTKKKTLADIPCSSDTVKQIVQTAVNQLFNNPQSEMTNELFSDSDSCLHIDYNTLIFDYCKEISQDMFVDNENIPLWKKTIKSLKRFCPKPKNPKDLSNIIIKKLNQIIDIDECEEKVNKFVIKKMHEEDSKWADLRMDEMNIRNSIVQSLINKLIFDSVTNIKSSFYLKFM